MTSRELTALAKKFFRESLEHMDKCTDSESCALYYHVIRFLENNHTKTLPPDVKGMIREL